MINVDLHFLQLVEGFLHCKIGSLSFDTYGCQLDPNLVWNIHGNIFLNLIWKRLNSWSHMYVSLGGRVIFLNSMLNYISVFTISFLNMHVKV